MPDSSKMEQRIETLGKIGDARLDLVPSLAECLPGLRPIEYNVVIAPAIAPKMIGSIVLPDESRESKGMAMQVGRVIAVSPTAFNYDNWPSEALKPKPGDIVWFARYAGGIFDGRDGREYRMVKDKDIGAVIEDARRLAIAAE